MLAAVLSAPRTMRIESIPDPAIGPADVLVRPLTVGICGTDFHLFDGDGNYNFDAFGRPIPLEQSPQVLGHEIFAEVVEAGRDAADLRPGDRVVVDQGWNCHSQGRVPCEFCRSGDSHQCEYYKEQGITGLQGALAEYLRVPAVNAVRVSDGLSKSTAALTEPLACVLHSSAAVNRANSRYRFGGELPVRTVLICGAGPAGLLFLQHLRAVENFEGPVLVAETNPTRRELARRLGGEVVDTRSQPLVETVLEKTHGRGVEYLIDAAGYGPLFKDFPGLIRNQATILLYAHGHRDAALGLLNPIQFKEACLVAAVGASGGFDEHRRPLMYQRSLELLAAGKIVVDPVVTHRYSGLANSLRAFTHDRYDPTYVKGVLELA